MPELMNDLDLGRERAEQFAERLEQYEPSTTPSEEVLIAVRAAGTLANLALFLWDGVQQRLKDGVEGGVARTLLGKASLTLAIWLKNIRIAIRPVEQWHEKVTFAFSLDELRYLEDNLLQARSSAERLLEFVSGAPPDISKELLDRIEAIGQDDDETLYLDSKTFQARARVPRGS
jgi:hypothetical protein